MVLGIASLVLLFVCGLGTLTAIVGVVLGVVALVKDSNRTRAIVGIVLSAVTLILAMILAAVLFNWFQSKNFGECFDPALHPTQESAQRCVERKLNGIEPGVVQQLDMN
jgi:disulfide bond formation protein DsbB